MYLFNELGLFSFIDVSGNINLNLPVSVEKKRLLSPSVPSPDIVMPFGASGYKLKRIV